MRSHVRSQQRRSLASIHVRGPEQVAQDTVAANYERLKPEILREVASRLRTQGIRTTIRQDLEEAYNLGWHGVYHHITQDKPVTSLKGLLYTITLRRALDLCRQRRDSLLAEAELERYSFEPDLAGDMDERRRLNRLLDRLKRRLSDKERRAVALCMLHGYKRAEAADLLGVDRSVFERIMDGATKKIGGIVASIEARGCGDEEWTRMLRAYALGLLDEKERDYRRAREHLEECPSCRRCVAGLRRVAVIVPPYVPASVGAAVLHQVQRVVWGHGGGANAAVSTLQAGPAAAGIGSSAAGGTTLLGSSVGSIKVAAVVLFAAAAGATAIHASQTEHHHRSAGGVPVNWAPDKARMRLEHEPTPPLPRGARGSGVRSIPANSVSRVNPVTRHTSPVQREFGIEQPRPESNVVVPNNRATTASVVSHHTSAPMRQPTSGASASQKQIKAVQHEFGPER